MNEKNSEKKITLNLYPEDFAVLQEYAKKHRIPFSQVCRTATLKQIGVIK